MNDSEILVLLHDLESEIASLKQVSSTLAQFISCEGNLESLSSELTTVSDEVIFLRKKLEQNKDKQSRELDSKFKALSNRLDRLEMDKSRSRFELAKKEKELSEIREDLAANSLQLSETKAHLETREKELVEYRRRIWELEVELERQRRPWWRKLIGCRNGVPDTDNHTE